LALMVSVVSTVSETVLARVVWPPSVTVPSAVVMLAVGESLSRRCDFYNITGRGRSLPALRCGNGEPEEVVRIAAHIRQGADIDNPSIGAGACECACPVCAAADDGRVALGSHLCPCVAQCAGGVAAAPRAAAAQRQKLAVVGCAVASRIRRGRGHGGLRICNGDRHEGVRLVGRGGGTAVCVERRRRRKR